MSGDRFDAAHPDNMPAYWSRLDSITETGRSRLADEEFDEVDAYYLFPYPEDVGWQPETARQQLPIGFEEWSKRCWHPCWLDYRDQMLDVPAGQAVGFDEWFAGVAINGARYGPRLPFLCDRFMELPPGWVRGDPGSTDVQNPHLQLAHAPSRHLVIRVCWASYLRATCRRLEDAGFDEFTTYAWDGSQMSYFVRDRRDSGRERPARPARTRPARTGSPGRGW